jgi:hypothetical protein
LQKDEVGLTIPDIGMEAAEVSSLVGIEAED